MDGFWGLIPAAGVGRRMGADRPKQYLRLAGRTVIEHTLDRFLSHPLVQGLVVVVDRSDRRWRELAVSGDPRVVTAPGGQERCESVLNGLRRLAAQGAPRDWVLVHDAARPCISRRDLDRVIETLRDDPVGGILATPVRDTLKRVDGQGRILETLDRTRVWHALTPQMFRIGALTEALEEGLAQGVRVTDEASAMERMGARPRLVEGSADNLKITHPEDLAVAELCVGRPAGAAG